MSQGGLALDPLVDESSSLVSEIAAALTEISSQAAELLTKMTEANSSTAELGASEKAVLERVQEAVRMTTEVQQEADAHAGEGFRVMQDNMRVIQTAVGESLQAIGELSVQSLAIGKIVTVIEGITKQTNLLALNAAILAAQSGAEGKSFSVVADEIRVLANRTARSAKEIAAMVGSVQVGANRAGEAVRRCQTHIEQSSYQSTAASDALGKVLQQAHRSADMVRGIGSAMEEQKQGIHLFTQVIDQMTRMIIFIERVASQHQKEAARSLQLADQMRHATRQIRHDGEEQAGVTQRISQSAVPLNERSLALIRMLQEQADEHSRLRAMSDESTLSATELKALGGQLHQVAATLQTMANRNTPTAADTDDQGVSDASRDRRFLTPVPGVDR